MHLNHRHLSHDEESAQCNDFFRPVYLAWKTLALESCQQLNQIPIPPRISTIEVMHSRFVLKPIALIIGRQGDAKVLPCLLLDR